MKNNNKKTNKKTETRQLKMKMKIYSLNRKLDSVVAKCNSCISSFIIKTAKRVSILIFY